MEAEILKNAQLHPAFHTYTNRLNSINSSPLPLQSTPFGKDIHKIYLTKYQVEYFKLHFYSNLSTKNCEKLDLYQGYLNQTTEDVITKGGNRLIDRCRILDVIASSWGAKNNLSPEVRSEVQSFLDSSTLYPTKYIDPDALDTTNRINQAAINTLPKHWQKVVDQNVNTHSIIEDEIFRRGGLKKNKC